MLLRGTDAILILCHSFLELHCGFGRFEPDSYCAMKFNHDVDLMTTSPISQIFVYA